jgi:NCAIR mutase (PurE)-related protein
MSPHLNPFLLRGFPIDSEKLKDLLERLQVGDVSIDAALTELTQLPYEDLGFAKLDHHRELRRGFPEVVLGLGKTPEQIAIITKSLTDKSDRVLVTRATHEAFAMVRSSVPDAAFHEAAKAIVVDRRANPILTPGVLIVTAGTSDLPVADEAALTAHLMGCEVERVTDVGVAGVHRVLDQLPTLRKARVIIAVAGMEGALPSLVSGLVSAPIIAVPTSIGYGASFGGIAALLGMLSSCSPGVSVVNIDNGFGAGYMAGLINNGIQE